ncbi:hypothetical protein SAMN06265353_1388 [Hydrogenobacter hydrogenophilus]|uniref:Uncharacterized protein n=1 Tax=Hydrogenobacter hydrogenophilus TaxID=35835 RepID=A0A285P228_9AQUI|nr:hypothetical protein SAMN06265353_1388 [Hydrogenobacter hydrogenophilus]
MVSQSSLTHEESSVLRELLSTKDIKIDSMTSPIEIRFDGKIAR